MLPKLVTEIPGPKSVSLARRLRKVESRNVTFVDSEFPVFWQRAEGANVWDVDGNCYLDTTSAFGVCGLGHRAPEIESAAIRQVGTLLHAMGDVHPAEAKVALCESLSRLTFERWVGEPGKTILCNSGSDAVEAALKTAFLFTGKRGVLGFRGGYHGLGYGALEASKLDYFRTPFKQQLAAFAHHAEFPTRPGAAEEEVKEILQKQAIGAIIVEPIQGRGGEIVPPDDFLPMLRKAADSHGAVLIFDEIYTGFLRTGRLFACEHWNTYPDVLCVGKGLTGGFPLSACIAKASVMDAWPPSNGEALHTSTFLGHPVGCAMALAALNAYQKSDLQHRVLKLGDQFFNALRKLRSPLIHEIRGKGLLIGIELRQQDGSPATEDALKIVKEALKDGILLLPGGPSGNVISLAPPFVITDDEARFVVAKLQEYLTSLPGSIS